MAQIRVRTHKGVEYDMDDRDLQFVNDSLKTSGLPPVRVVPVGPPELPLYELPNATQPPSPPPVPPGGSPMEAAADAFAGLRRGITSGPLSQYLMSPEERQSREPYLAAAKSRSPLAFKIGNFAGEMFTPEAVTGGKAAGAIGGKLAKLYQGKQVEKVLPGAKAMKEGMAAGGKMTPQEAGSAVENLASPALSPKAAAQEVVPVLGAGIGALAGSEVPILGHLGGAAGGDMLGRSLTGVPLPTKWWTGMKAPIEDLAYLLRQGPATRYQLARGVAPGFNLAGRLSLGPGMAREDEE